MERLLLEEEERNRRPNSSSGRRQISSSGSESVISDLVRQLVEMGFPPNWCAEALSSNGYNTDEALTWLLANDESLNARDQGESNTGEDNEDDGADSMSDEAEAAKLDADKKDSKQHPSKLYGWRQDIVCPIRSISGSTNIDHETLTVSGLPTGGFSSVGMKGIVLHTGKWYYEAELLTDGCLQIGWADSSFSGHCKADRGDGCGDGPSSWAFDGWRRYRWHSTATAWGCRWQEGDVVGCLLDMDRREISFTLNGRGEEIGMGLAFSGDGFRPCGGVYACVSFNRKEKLRLLIGDGSSNSFHYSPPRGYKGVGESVMECVHERTDLLKSEAILNRERENSDVTRLPYICDFSDGEHGHELFAWQHRYYGADASVHLGGRRKNRNVFNKNQSSLANTSSSRNTMDSLYIDSIDAQLLKTWESDNFEALIKKQNVKQIESLFNKSYGLVIENILREMKDVALAICLLYSRKFIMHILITLSSEFEISLFEHNGSSDDDTQTAYSIWSILEKCCGLHAAGWVGEASAMAVASEALGLSISSHDRAFHNSPYSNFMGTRSLRVDSNQSTVLPMASLCQFLTPAKAFSGTKKSNLVDPSSSLASCAEAALGGEAGGSIVFVRSALQNAIINSVSLVNVLLAVVSRSVRLLSSVDFGHSSPSFNEIDDDVSRSLTFLSPFVYLLLTS
jgi:hypothetical protein